MNLVLSREQTWWVLFERKTKYSYEIEKQDIMKTTRRVWQGTRYNSRMIQRKKDWRKDERLLRWLVKNFLESDFRQWIQERVNNRHKYKLQHIRALIKEGKFIYIWKKGEYELMFLISKDVYWVRNQTMDTKDFKVF